MLMASVIYKVPFHLPFFYSRNWILFKEHSKPDHIPVCGVCMQWISSKEPFIGMGLSSPWPVPHHDGHLCEAE